MNERILKKAFGEVIRERRKALGLSQEEIAESSGLHRTYISLIERGIKSPTLISIFGLAAALKAKPEELVKATRAGMPTKGGHKKSMKGVHTRAT
jgi:transcriptional regulator with XRE-family HTH domain